MTVNQTMTPSGVEQIGVQIGNWVTNYVNQTMTPSGVEQSRPSTTPSGRCPGEPDDDAFGR